MTQTQEPKKSEQKFLVSVVIPAMNEEGNILPLINELKQVLSVYPNYEILFIDDGSTDQTLEILTHLNQKDSRIRYISFSRNFGHQNALKAGLDHANGDCVITMDADLQHPPELIPQMIEKWKEGYEIVYTIRDDDPNLSIVKRTTSDLFYRIMNSLSDIHLHKGAADYRLLDRATVDALKNIKEYHLFFRGMTAWIGFKQYGITYTPGQRLSGETKYSLKKMCKFAVTGITSFSLKPLRISIFLGFSLAIGTFIYALYAIFMKFFSDQVIHGWASVLVSVLFIGGIQLIVLGIIGEYIGKLFMETKHRPHYIIKKESKNENF